MWQYLDSADSVVAIINRAVPYYVTGVAVAIGFKMGLFNIGADGQYRLAALLAAAAGAAVTLPGPLHVALHLPRGHRRRRRLRRHRRHPEGAGGVNEVVSTIMLNFIATGIRRSCCRVPPEPKAVNLVAETKPIPPSGVLPPLNRLLRGGSATTCPPARPCRASCPSPSSSAILYYVVVWRTRFGFELRTTGVNPARRPGRAA